MNSLAQVNIGDRFLGQGAFLTQLTDIGSLVTIILRVAFSVAGIILIVLLIMGGISIISGAGSDNPEKTAKGKEAITSALIGFIVVFSAFWIVRLIEIITGLTLLG